VNQFSFMFSVGTLSHTFLAIHPCLPVEIFGQKFSSARNHTLVYRPISCCL